jgi:hypothetical protein
MSSWKKKTFNPPVLKPPGVDQGATKYKGYIVSPLAQIVEQFTFPITVKAVKKPV